MGEPQINPEALQRAKEIYSELSEARTRVESGEFLTLQSTLRRIEGKTRSLHYSEKLSVMGQRIAELERKLNNQGKSEQ